jgi:hypothetical protein
MVGYAVYRQTQVSEVRERGRFKLAIISAVIGLAVGLFLALVLAKFGIGTYEYLAGVRDSAGFGEVMVMIAVMVGVQAQIVCNRAKRLTGKAPAAPRPTVTVA